MKANNKNKLLDLESMLRSHGRRLYCTHKLSTTPKYAQWTFIRSNYIYGVAVQKVTLEHGHIVPVSLKFRELDFYN